MLTNHFPVDVTETVAYFIFPGEDSMKDSLDLTNLWEFDPMPFEIHRVMLRYLE